MKLWLKTLVLAVILALSCIVSYYAPDGLAVVLLICGVIMYILSQA